MKQIWACNQCRSINDVRSKRCYKCLTPREQAEVDPTKIAPTATLADKPVLELPPYRSALLYAVIAGSLIALATGLQLINTINLSFMARQAIDGTSDLSVAQEQYIAAKTVIDLVVAVSAFVMFGVWLSQAVSTVPALGLGYTRVTPRQALYEVLFPLGLLAVAFGLGMLAIFLFTTEPAAAALAAIIGLVVTFAGYLALVRRVPAVIWDLMRRLDPNSGRAGILVAGAWFGLVLGWLVPRLGGFLVALNDGITGASMSLLMEHVVYLEQIATALYLMAGTCLVGIIVWVQAKSRAVARQIAKPAAPDAGAAPA